jgi:sulfur-oxidizing protein SoxA
MLKLSFASAAAGGLFLTAAGLAFSESTDLSKHVADGKKSGYVFAAPETREMMDDDFNNPSFLWVERGEMLWSAIDGGAGKSCESCHGDARTTMKGVGAIYPKYDERVGKVVTLEQRIDMCRLDRMQAEAFPWESEQLLGLTAFVKLQSRGMPVNVAADGSARPFWEKGKEFYYQRRGQLDVSCANCHEENAGKHLRTELLSEGHSNGFPLYRLKWQGFGSLQKRIAGCNEEIRAQPYPLGSDEYTNLELYLAWRGNGLPVETPAVRK